MANKRDPKLLRVYSKYQKDISFAHLRNGRNFVPGKGRTKDPKAMFIGEAPGSNEDRKREPFVGVAGRILDEMLSSIGLKRDEVFITNVVKYRPPGNRTPTEEEIEASRPYLRKEVNIIRPSILVPMGAAALKLVQPGIKGGISAHHGRPIYTQTILVFPVYHPMVAVYGGEKAKESMLRDYRRLGELL